MWKQKFNGLLNTTTLSEQFIKDLPNMSKGDLLNMSIDDEEFSIGLRKSFKSFVNAAHFQESINTIKDIHEIDENKPFEFKIVSGISDEEYDNWVEDDHRFREKKKKELRYLSNKLPEKIKHFAIVLSEFMYNPAFKYEDVQYLCEGLSVQDLKNIREKYNPMIQQYRKYRRHTLNITTIEEFLSMTTEEQNRY